MVIEFFPDEMEETLENFLRENYEFDKSVSYIDGRSEIDVRIVINKGEVTAVIAVPVKESSGDNLASEMVAETYSMGDQDVCGLLAAIIRESGEPGTEYATGDDFILSVKKMGNGEYKIIVDYNGELEVEENEVH